MAFSNKPSLLVEQKRIEAILKNKHTFNYWEDRKKGHEEVFKNLEHYAGKLKENVMVPIGKRGLMRGRIINTNQIFVSLGAGWFTKVCTSEAQKICERRIHDCVNMLGKLEKEKKILEGWTALVDKEIFGTEESKEIIEPYIEKEEEVWKKHHLQKVKEHRKKLAEVRKDVEESRGKDKSTEEELWKHLELLELQEEMEDELLRLGEDDESSTESEEESAASTTPLDSDDSLDDRETDDETNNKIIKGNELRSIISNKQKPPINTNNEKDKVKKVRFNETIEEALSEKVKLNQTNIKFHHQNLVNNVLTEVIEHNINKPNINQSSTRPVSKFKSSRLSKKD